MITEVKLKNKSRKVLKNYQQYNKNKHKYNKINKYNKKTVKNKKFFVNDKKGNLKGDLKLQKGGEVVDLTDIDTSQFSVTKNMNANIDWKSLPQNPPMPDCTIL